MNPVIGSTVLYTLSAGDQTVIRSQREAMNAATGQLFGNPAQEGQVYPAKVVRNYENGIVNLQVHLDGPDTYWATSRVYGTGEGQWHWPAHRSVAMVTHADEAGPVVSQDTNTK